MPKIAQVNVLHQGSNAAINGGRSPLAEDQLSKSTFRKKTASTSVKQSQARLEGTP